VTGTTPVDGGDGEDGSDDEDDEGDDDDNGHGNDCDTDPSNPSDNDPPAQEEDCEGEVSDDDGGSDDSGSGDEDECEVEEDDGSPGTDDRGIGNNPDDTDPDNPNFGSSWEGEEDGGCDEEDGDGTAEATFGYENTYPGAVYLTPGPELPTGLFEPEERNDLRVNRTSDPVGEEGPSVVGLDSVGFEVQDTTRYGAGDGGLPSRFPAGSPDSVLNVTGLDGQQLVTWYLGDEAATAGGSSGDSDGRDGDSDDSDDDGEGDSDDDDNDDSDDSRKAISFVAACPVDDDIESLDITITETKDGGEPVAIEWTSDHPVETVVLKAGTSMENFDAGGSTSGAAAVGEGTAAGSGQTASSPCPDGDGLKYEWDGGSFEQE
jgi:hypothetical protein